MNDKLRIQALQAALDQANMQIIEQREVMGVALKALHRVDAVERGMVTTKAHHYAAREETTIAITALREMLGGTE